jgi:hypothetical protein
MTSPETKKYPNPVYAAAGAGDLAYQRLRKLPAKVAELREKVAASDTEATVDNLRTRVDVEKIRAAYRRNAQAVVTGARAASERASALYADLIARGEQVVRSARTPDAQAPIQATVVTRPTEQIEPTPGEQTETGQQ